MLDSRSSSESASVLADALLNLNSQRCFVVLHEDYLVAILYSAVGDSSLAHKKTLDELDKYVFGPYGVPAGISQVFRYITDLNMGFRQAIIALDHYESLMLERSLDDEGKTSSAASFEAVMPYYLITADQADRRFHEFCMSHSPLEKLLETDLAEGTRDFALLWFYLSYERSASLAGKRMFMHRNSVLYHVKQVEKRFGFSLSDSYCREKLMLDYRFIFSRMSDETKKQLFS